MSHMSQKTLPRNVLRKTNVLAFIEYNSLNLEKTLAILE